MAESIIPRDVPSEGTSHALVGKQLGRYEVLCHLATGGMATVYVARAQGLAGFERLVAIKLLHPHLAHEEEFIGMFLDEARLAARIRHPNVVATQDISDSDGDGFFLVMDYVEGDHLARILSRTVKLGTRLDEGIVGRILIDALSGLDAAHKVVDERGDALHLVHRDVSPENVLVGTDGVARLTDFGVARAESRVSSTRAGQFKGKISYMSPEQASTGDCDQRSDLFSMGVVLWEALTSKRLFRGDSNATTLSRLLNEPIPLPSDVDPSLIYWDPVLDKALARDPDERFQTASEFVEAIENVLLGRGGLASPRMLSAAVKEFVGDKVEEQQQRIRIALDAYSVADEATCAGAPIEEISSGMMRVSQTATRVPIPASRSQSAIPASQSRPAIPLPQTKTGMPATRSRPQVQVPDFGTASGEFSMTGSVYVVDHGSKRTSVILTVSLILVAAMAATAGYFASRANRDMRPLIIQTTPAAESTRERNLEVPASLAANPPGTELPAPAPATSTTRRPSSTNGSSPMRRQAFGVPLESNPYRTDD